MTYLKVIRWYEQDDGSDDPVYVPLDAVCGVYANDREGPNETLTLRLKDGSHVYTEHRPTISTFWNMTEVL